MEVAITKEKLVSGVQTAERIVSTKSTLPIIGNLLFEAAKDHLKISANNLEMGLEIKVEAKVLKEGSVLIPAKTLSGIVAKLPDTKINLNVNDRGLVKISYQESHLSIHGLPAEEFPSLAKVKEDISFRVDAPLFARMIEETIFAVSANEDKLVLTGILLEVGKSKAAGDNSNLRLVATDGYRLAKKSEKIEGIAGGEKSVIVPARVLSELSKVISETSGTVNVVVSAEQISFKFGDVYMVSRLIQGQFPDYKQVIPRKSETQITVATDLLLDAAQRAAVIASSSANIIRMETKGEKLHLIAN
ncbi:MAG: DNA polymerase III subunit beta, partial [Candidatus Margulisiibacteriota bacterium]